MKEKPLVSFDSRRDGECLKKVSPTSKPLVSIINGECLKKVSPAFMLHSNIETSCFNTDLLVLLILAWRGVL